MSSRFCPTFPCRPPGDGQVQAGTLAEFAVLPAASVVAKPAEIDFVTAAAIPLAGGAAVTRTTPSIPLEKQVPSPG